MHKTTGEVWVPYRLVILLQKSLFYMQKPQIRTGTHRDLLFGSKSRCFVCKNHRWGLGPIETSNSGANHAVLHAQNDRWGLEPIETSDSGANHAVLYAQNDRWYLGPIEICYSGPKVAVLHAKNTDDGWDPWGLVILMLGALFYMHKVTGEVWDK